MSALTEDAKAAMLCPDCGGPLRLRHWMGLEDGYLRRRSALTCTPCDEKRRAEVLARIREDRNGEH